MTLARRILVLAVAGTLSMVFVPAVSLAKAPAYYHHYYVYPDSMTWCGKLVKEVFRNANRNWRFTKRKVSNTAASFSVGDVRGTLRCLAKKSKESWVVITTAGNNSSRTKDLFEELRLGVCGRCAALFA